MRRSVGMRDSMCLFLQLEGAVEGENGFEAEEVLQVCLPSLHAIAAIMLAGFMSCDSLILYACSSRRPRPLFGRAPCVTVTGQGVRLLCLTTCVKASTGVQCVSCSVCRATSNLLLYGSMHEGCECMFTAVA